MHLAHDELVCLFGFYTGIHSVDVERIVELTLKGRVLNEHKTRTVYKVGRIGVGGVELVAVAKGIEAVKVDIVAGLRQNSHSVAGMYCYIFKRDIRGILAEESASESASGREYRDVAYGWIAFDSVKTKLIVADVLKAHIPEVTEGMVSRAWLDLAGVAAVFD